MTLYKDYFNNINETDDTDPFILGYIRRMDPVGVIDYKITNNDNDRHPKEWTETGLTWKFIPEIGLLTFWEPPEKSEIIAIKDWMDKHHYKIKKTYVLGRSFSIKKPKIGSSELERKPLGMDESINNWCAIVLDSESHNKLISLFSKIIPENWVIKAHHCTIDPFAPIKDSSQLGRSVSLMVTAFGIDNKACAVKVIGYDGETNNSFPHVTIAVNELQGGKAKDSNDIQNWTPIKSHIILTGTIENL